MTVGSPDLRLALRIRPPRGHRIQAGIERCSTAWSTQSDHIAVGVARHVDTLIRGLARYPLMVFRRILASAVFAVAAASALAASMGVVVPPHQEEPGAPPLHDHVLAAYRFAFLLPPAEHRTELSPDMAALHRLLAEAGVRPDAIWQMPAMGRAVEPPATLPTIKSASQGPIQDLAIEFALLVIVLPRLARPTRRVIAEIPLPRIPEALWRLAPALAPPRLAVLPSAAA